MTQLFASDLEAACAKARSEDAASVGRARTIAAKIWRYLRWAVAAAIVCGVIALIPRAQMNPPKPWSSEDKVTPVALEPQAEVRRATLVMPTETEVRRAVPAELVAGRSYTVTLPPAWGSLKVPVTFCGTVRQFKDIGVPHLGDMYKSLDTPGQTWVYCVPAGYTHPVWVDP